MATIPDFPAHGANSTESSVAAPRAGGAAVTTPAATWLARGAAATIGLGSAAIGYWAFTDPVAFAAWTEFPVHIHFLHDLGAFQIGIGLTLLLALVWRDALLVALGGFLVGNTLHVVSHLRDQALGGRPNDWIWLSLGSVAALLVMLLYWRGRRARSRGA